MGCGRSATPDVSAIPAPLRGAPGNTKVVRRCGPSRVGLAVRPGGRGDYVARRPGDIGAPVMPVSLCLSMILEGLPREPWIVAIEHARQTPDLPSPPRDDPTKFNK